jgi:hypothetical protein
VNEGNTKYAVSSQVVSVSSQVVSGCCSTCNGERDATQPLSGNSIPCSHASKQSSSPGICMPDSSWVVLFSPVCRSISWRPEPPCPQPLVSTSLPCPTHSLQRGLMGTRAGNVVSQESTILAYARHEGAVGLPRTEISIVARNQGY